MNRLNTNAAMLVYDDLESNKLIFLGRYKQGGCPTITRLKHAYEEKYGKLINIKFDE